MNTNKKYKVSKWIFLSLSVLMNTFLLLYSTLPREITIHWSNFVTNIFTNIINTITHKEVVTILLTDLDISFSNETNYKYNYIPGYELNEIPLGSAKQIEYTFAPENATDKSIEYYVDDSEIVSLSQSNGVLSVIGMKEGTTTVYGKNKLSGLVDSCEVIVTKTVEPQSFEISLDNTDIEIGKQETINFDINGGNLGHNELINFRYYDIRELDYKSLDTAIATVDNNGVIHPASVGQTTIVVSNDVEVSKSIDINIVDGIEPSLFDTLNIRGSNICYGNDMINDQNSGKNHYELEIYDGDTKLDNNDFVWESSNELIARVDKYGVLRGFRKLMPQDEIVTIKAISKITNQETSFEVTVKEQMPNSMYYWIVNNDKTTWNPKEYTACVGDNLVLNVGYDISIWRKEVEVVVSNENVIECTNQGSSIALSVKIEGNCTITFTSISNNQLSHSVKFTVLKAGAIDTNDIDDVNSSIRKIIGHASLFAIAEIFTLIALYMFMYNKKLYLPIVISLGIELFISSISELIQHFTPNRHGTITDVLINMSGAIIGSIIVFLVILLVNYIKKKKSISKK